MSKGKSTHHTLLPFNLSFFGGKGKSTHNSLFLKFLLLFVRIKGMCTHRPLLPFILSFFGANGKSTHRALFPIHYLYLLGARVSLPIAPCFLSSFLFLGARVSLPFLLNSHSLPSYIRNKGKSTNHTLLPFIISFFGVMGKSTYYSLFPILCIYLLEARAILPTKPFFLSSYLSLGVRVSLSITPYFLFLIIL